MKSVSQLGDSAGKRVVVRCDFNMPLDGGKNITDDGRIHAALPIPNELCDAGARIVILAHLGRPKGEPDPKFSLAPVATRLSELLGARVKLATDVVGPSAKATIESLGDGEVALLENVRFEAGEKSKDKAARRELAEKYAAFGDFFVSNGFDVVHRKEAFVYGIAKLLSSVAGSLVKAEVDVLEGLTENPKRPFVVMLSGAKVADKLAVIDNLLKVADTLVIGGGMAFTFLKVQGLGVGNSLVDGVSIEACTGYLKAVEAAGKRILLPVDVRVASEIDFGARTVGQVDVVPTDAIPADKMDLDIGPTTEELFDDTVRQARSVFWNGPIGVLETPGLESGTRAVTQAPTEINGISVVGGDDLASTVRALGFPEDAFGHISTGGDVLLELMEGKILPDIVVLKEGNRHGT